MAIFCSKPIISTTVSTPSPAIYNNHPTTPYPGLLQNSVAPEEEEEPKLEALTEVAEEDQEVEEQTTDESESEYAEASSTVEQTSSDSEQEESLPPTARHHTVQPKRLEDLFPLERTRPVNWPSAGVKPPST